MRHRCSACLRDFFDESGHRPPSGHVHCVFCGAKIAVSPACASAVPFSKDYEREEAFALGVISSAGPGFPDTLRQFRVRSAGASRKKTAAASATPKTSDTLWPVSQGPEPVSTPPDAPLRWRSGSLASSLLVGFAVGVAAAGALTVYPRPGTTSRAASSPTSSLAETASAAASAAAAAQPRQTAPPSLAVATCCPAASTAAAKAVATKLPNPSLERRWLLDRARSQQHQYRLDDAERLYRQVLAHAPRDSEALSGLGELELLRGTLDLADARFQQALAVNADYIPALVAVADIRWQAGHIEQARQAYQDIVSRYSADLYPPYVALRGAAVVAPQCDAER